MASPPAPPPLSRATRLWYASGQFAEGVKNESFANFLLFYYNQVLGLSGSKAGLAIFIALLFDAVTDPLVGALSDRTRSRWGRRHPFLFASAIPLVFTFYGVFAPPGDLTQWQLFAWMVGFTVLSSRLTAARTVSLLNQIFSAFDTICEEEGVEKIKTIGDGYMAIAGAPTARADHALALARVAIRMRDYMAARPTKEDLNLRIGLNTGTVVGAIARR